MGYDLEPRNKNCPPLHKNITGWENTYRRLEAAGADLSRWSWTNDGDVIPRKTAKSWGRLLRAWLREGGRSEDDLRFGTEFADFCMQSRGFKIY